MLRLSPSEARPRRSLRLKGSRLYRVLRLERHLSPVSAEVTRLLTVQVKWILIAHLQLVAILLTLVGVLFEIVSDIESFHD